MMHWTDSLVNLGACSAAVVWAKAFGSIQDAWEVCERGDWMLWLAGKLSGPPGSESRRPLVLAACECARLVLPYVQAGETRPLEVIEIAEKWARREEGVTVEMVRSAASDAFFSAASAAAYYGRAEVYKWCADIVRKYYPVPPEKEEG